MRCLAVRAIVWFIDFLTKGSCGLFSSIAMIDESLHREAPHSLQKSPDAPGPAAELVRPSPGHLERQKTKAREHQRVFKEGGHFSSDVRSSLVPIINPRHIVARCIGVGDELLFASDDFLETRH